MSEKPILISTGKLTRQALAGQTAIVTGAGGGIGLEAARALLWLGAAVVIAEIDAKKGKAAEKALQGEFGRERVLFVQTDVGDERSVANLARQAQRAFQKVDIVLNNATYAPMGAVVETSIQDWDASYRVNLRGPVLLARAFLPGMIARDQGAFACVSSAGGAYMGAYETVKSAQVGLATTLDAELEGTNVYAFTISPGIVPTETMLAGVARIAPRYGKSVEEFNAQYQAQWLSVEAAGTGFAAAIALAAQFKGIETYSTAGLNAAGITAEDSQPAPSGAALSEEQVQTAWQLCQEVRATLAKEHAGWLKRPVFERQWMLRDFKQAAGTPVEHVLEELAALEGCLELKETAGVGNYAATVSQVERYYQHYQVLAQGAMKDPEKVREWVGMMQGWRETAQKLETLLRG